MKKFIKENWFKTLAVLFLLSLGIGLFYWYEWRPSEIKKECVNMAKEKATKLLKTRSELSGYNKYDDEIKKGLYLRDDYEALYQNCLRENGL